MKYNYFDRDLPKEYPPHDHDYTLEYPHERGEGLTTKEFQLKYTDFI